jgi:NADH:ubiquinone oxidoreductase subunit 4 (subunit M)
MNAREMWAIGPICALCLLIGVLPQPFLATIKPDVDAIAALYSQPATAVAAASEMPTEELAQARSTSSGIGN